ncbi:MAG: NAD(P)-dependent alcohol dehydrogenase [Candidatus Limnocylindrales bacterium]
MRALFQDVYGEPEEVLSVREVEQPTFPDDGVLVRVHAASIHIGDCFVVRGVPKAMRPVFGLRRPKAEIPGMDLAGTVEAVGSAVTTVKAGDEVFGNGSGTFAEYAVAKADKLAPKPESLSFEEAAALGVSAQTALQALRDQLKVEAGMKVLVIGASGGVGSFAVQIAKSMGAEVTGVCSTPNVEMVRSLGADHVIDYKTEDYVGSSERYDRILDNVAARPMGQVRKLLTPEGKLLSNGAPVQGWFGGLGNVIRGLTVSMVNKQQARPFISVSTGEDARALAELVEAGKLKPAIGRTFSLDEGPQAVAYVATGHGQGKTVITMG